MKLLKLLSCARPLLTTALLVACASPTNAPDDMRPTTVPPPGVRRDASARLDGPATTLPPDPDPVVRDAAALPEVAMAGADAQATGGHDAQAAGPDTREAADTRATDGGGSTSMPIIQDGLVVTVLPSEAAVPRAGRDRNVMLQYAFSDPTGNTAVRAQRTTVISPNLYPPNSKSIFGDHSKWPPEPKRDRDLGQTFVTGASPFTLDALYLRVGPDRDPGADLPNARVAIQMFRVDGNPTYNTSGTGKESDPRIFDRVNSTVMDDFLEGETYTPIMVAIGKLPPKLLNGDFMKWDFVGGAEIRLEANRGYAFLVMLLDPAPEMQLTLANVYFGTYAPDPRNKYRAHGIRREAFTAFDLDWTKRLHQAPGTFGFPDVCTFRDLTFTITGRP